MISNIFDFEKTKLSFINAFKSLKLNKLLNQSNITKAKGHIAIDIFLLSLDMHVIAMVKQLKQVYLYKGYIRVVIIL